MALLLCASNEARKIADVWHRSLATCRRGLRSRAIERASSRGVRPLDRTAGASGRKAGHVTTHYSAPKIETTGHRAWRLRWLDKSSPESLSQGDVPRYRHA